MGYVEETGASQHMRDARITTIYEGTTGIQANDLIGRKLAREGGRTLKALLGRIDGDARRLVESPDAVLAQIGRALAAAAQALDEAVDWLLAHDGQPAQCAAGAVPFLRLAGTVIGGWLSARMAEAATAQLAAGAGDAGFSRYQACHSQPLRGACPGAGADVARHRHGRRRQHAGPGGRSTLNDPERRPSDENPGSRQAGG
eukprot:Opistho-1_new@16748